MKQTDQAKFRVRGWRLIDAAAAVIGVGCAAYGMGRGPRELAGVGWILTLLAAANELRLRHAEWAADRPPFGGRPLRTRVVGSGLTVLARGIFVFALAVTFNLGFPRFTLFQGTWWIIGLFFFGITVFFSAIAEGLKHINRVDPNARPTSGRAG